MQPTPKRTQRFNNADLLAEIVACQRRGNVVSDKLAATVLGIAHHYSRRANFRGYSWREDMVSAAVCNLVLPGVRNSTPAILRFDPKRSSNAFAYVTSAIYHRFLQFLNRERRQRRIVDEYLIAAGLEPSVAAQVEHEMQQRAAG